MIDIQKIKTIIDEADRMRGAYFFKAPRNASARRSYEKFHSHPMIEWTEGGNVFTAEFEVNCSCNNVYAKGAYTKNGVRTTLAAVRNSYKRLIAKQEVSENDA